MSLLRWMLLIVTINVALAGCTPVVSPSFKGHRLPGNIAALTGARAEKLKDVLPGRYERWHAAALKESP